MSLISTRAGAFLTVTQNAAATDYYLLAHGDSLSDVYTPVTTETYIKFISDRVNSTTPKTSRFDDRGIVGISYNYAWPTSGYPLTLIEDAKAGYNFLPNFSDNRLSSNTIDHDLKSGGSITKLVVWAGTNGLAIVAHTPAQEYTDFQTYITDRFAANPAWQPNQIFVCTTIPRSGLDETVRATWNGLLVGGVATYGYTIVRLDLDSRIGLTGCNLDLTYYNADQTHLNITGQQVVADLIYPLMFP